jgi:hypothetical protein
MIPPDTYLQPRFAMFELEALTDSAAWHDLSPNQPIPGDAHPSTLDANELFDIANASLTAFRSGLQTVEGNASKVAHLDGGETKECFTVTTDSGVLVVQILPTRRGAIHDSVRVPDHPKLTLIKTDLGRSLWEYNDSRVYAELPLGRGYTMRLVEHAGHPIRNQSPLDILKQAIARQRVLRSIERELNPHPDDARTYKPELNKPRHALNKSGKVQIIDIPVLTRTSAVTNPRKTLVE